MSLVTGYDPDEDERPARSRRGGYDEDRLTAAGFALFADHVKHLNASNRWERSAAARAYWTNQARIALDTYHGSIGDRT